MAEYIEREKAIEHIITHLPYRCSEDFIEGQKDCVEQLKSLPSADVVEVVHGEWVYKKEKDGYFCSVCDIEALIDPNFIGRDFAMEELSDYCPHCGAKMDGDVDEGKIET